MQEAAWHDRREKMPARDDSDEQAQIWSWMAERGVFVIALRDFERSTYLHDWHPRQSQPKPQAPRGIA